MSSTKSIQPLRDNTSHQRYSDNDHSKLGRGKNTRLLIGRLHDPANPDLRARSFIKFDVSDWFDDVEYVESMVLELTSAGGGDLQNGDTGRIDVLRLTKQFSEGSFVTFHSEDYEWPTVDWTLKVGSNVPGAVIDDSPLTLNVLPVVRRWAPKTVEFAPGGLFGMGKDNHGFALMGSPESASSAAVQVWSSESSISGYRPHLTMVYRPKNSKPTAGLTSPSGPESMNFLLEGTFSDPDEDDHMTQVEVQARKTSATDWEDGHLIFKVIRDLEDVSGIWSIADFDRSKLRKNVDYEARCRVYDIKSHASNWTSVSPFTVIAAAPTVTAVPVGSQPDMTMALTAGWTVDALTEIVSIDVQLGTRGFGTTLWSTSYAPTQEERDNDEVRAVYTGPNLAAGDYEWRVRVTDGLDAQSAWSNDATLVLTVGAPADEGLLSLTTSYSPVVAAQRIILKRMRSEDRGPGAVVAIIEDASNIGASWYATAPGEFYFTLPVTHPQVSVCEPMTTHYSWQQYTQGHWKEMAAGLLRDFDANEDDVVVYGVDYLGLLSMSVEAAKQSEKDSTRGMPTKITGTDGSRYYQKTIRHIISDQLKRARLQDTHSPVLFIETGHLANFNTKVTIYASFAERLSFIRGLIDSHKGGQVNGEERRSRLRVRYNPAAGGGQGRYQFEALDAVGQDRDNIRLEYGGLIQGYRVIALDDFATKIYGIGKVPNHTLPNFSMVNAPGISQADWGAIGRANFWNDLVDSSDLTRRARNMATRMSRIGKRIALGIRVAGLRPFDGYDILDSFPVDIRDGVVDTTEYGSGYWTLWGMEYRVFPDEHDEITFVLRPKGDTAPIDSDLIPSRPIHFVSDFVWGNGPP